MDLIIVYKMGRFLVAVGLSGPLLLLALLPAQLALPVEAGVNPMPQMTMSFSSSGLIARPSFFEPGIAQVSGTLSIDKIPGERFVVTLSGSIDTGWGVGITPSMHAFQNNIRTVTFTVTVTVPPATPVELIGNMRIEARGDSLNLQPRIVGHVVVSVAPFYKLYIDSPNPYKEVTPGSRLSFLVELRNMGNSPDSYDIYIENQEELTGMGWTVSFSTPVVTKVRAADSKTVRLYVMAPQKSTLYKAEGSIINVRAISQNARDENLQVDMVYPFVVYERGTFIEPFGTSWGMFLLLIIVVPSAYVFRRARRWLRSRPRPAPEDSDYQDESDDYDDDYEDGDYDEEEADDDYDDGYDDKPAARK